MEHHADMNIREEQRRRLQAVSSWARRMRCELQGILDAQGDRVHFRPSSGGVAMVGLLPEKPQRGKSGIHDLTGLVTNFEELFAVRCKDIPQGRVTGEKALQSWLIRDGNTHDRRLDSINAASARTDCPVELVFVTDEISLPVEGGKIVCDILALRKDGGRSTPVLLELKDDRLLTRLIEQVEGYARLIDDHADLFEELFGALLGEKVKFDAPTEKWIVWPSAGENVDPREDELTDRRIRVVGYTEDGGCKFRIGNGVESG
jgi:hypothetical protein